MTIFDSFFLVFEKPKKLVFFYLTWCKQNKKFPSFESNFYGTLQNDLSLIKKSFLMMLKMMHDSENIFMSNLDIDTQTELWSENEISNCPNL